MKSSVLIELDAAIAVLNEWGLEHSDKLIEKGLMNTRTYHILRSNGINTILDLGQWSAKEISQWRQAGNHTGLDIIHYICTVIGHREFNKKMKKKSLLIQQSLANNLSSLSRATDKSIPSVTVATYKRTPLPPLQQSATAARRVREQVASIHPRHPVSAYELVDQINKIALFTITVDEFKAWLVNQGLLDKNVATNNGEGTPTANGIKAGIFLCYKSPDKTYGVRYNSNAQQTIINKLRAILITKETK